MKRSLCMVLILMFISSVSAEVRLPSVLGSNMVLQRNTQVNFWGQARPVNSIRIET